MFAAGGFCAMTIGRNHPLYERVLVILTVFGFLAVLRSWSALSDRFPARFFMHRGRTPGMAPIVDERRKPPRFFGLLLATIFVLVFVYVLSVGPAYWLYNNRRMSEKACDTLYSPVWWCYGHTSTGRWVVTWYLEFWVHDNPNDPFGPFVPFPLP